MDQMSLKKKWPLLVVVREERLASGHARSFEILIFANILTTAVLFRVMKLSCGTKLRSYPKSVRCVITMLVPVHWLSFTFSTYLN